MKVRILQEFRDRADFTKVYPVGETHTFDNELAISLISRGLAEEVVEPIDEAAEEAEEAKEVAESEEVVAEPIVDNEAETVEMESEQPSEEVVGKVQPIFLHEKENAPTTAKKKRSTKDN